VQLLDLGEQQSGAQSGSSRRRADAAEESEAREAPERERERERERRPREDAGRRERVWCSLAANTDVWCCFLSASRVGWFMTPGNNWFVSANPCHSQWILSFLL
jgi:hypothetical protein